MNKWILAAVFGCTPVLANAADGTLEGLMPYEPGNGATVLMRGVLTQKEFKVESVRVVAARLAGKAADPDQFRMQLLDAEGRSLGSVATWSPLLAFEWERNVETASTSESRLVEIAVPASFSVDSVVLSWSDTREIARVSVGREIRQFCERSPG